MSLDDRFNPNDGSLIDTLDSALFEFNKKIVTVWQNKTYKSKADLERFLYFGSAIALSENVVNRMNILMAIPAVNAAIRGAFEMTRPKNSMLEEMECEANGFPGKTLKYINVLAYSAGAITTLVGVGNLVAIAIYGDNKRYMDSVSLITTGLGVLCLISADYMAKSDIGDPTPKPKKKPVLEIIKDKITELLPQPTTEPVPVNGYSRIENYVLAYFKD